MKNNELHGWEVITHGCTTNSQIRIDTLNQRADRFENAVKAECERTEIRTTKGDKQ